MNQRLLHSARSRSNRNRQSGGVYHELVLVLPIMLLIAGYAFQFTRILQARQVATIVSRELATDIFRNCSDILVQSVVPTGTCNPNSSGQICVDQVLTQGALGQCIQTISRRYRNNWGTLMPSGYSDETLSVTVNFYRHDLLLAANNLGCLGPASTNQNLPTTRFQLTMTQGSTSNPTVSSEIPAFDSPSLNTDQQLMCLRNRVVDVNVQFSIDNLKGLLLPFDSANATKLIQDRTMI